MPPKQPIPGPESEEFRDFLSKKLHEAADGLPPEPGGMKRIATRLRDKLFNTLDRLIDEYDQLNPNSRAAKELISIINKSADDYAKLEDSIQRYKEEELQEIAKLANDSKGMGVEAQQIIDQARAAAQQPEQAVHPEPDISTTLTAITAEAVELKDMRAELQEQRIPLTDVEAKRTIAGLGVIATRSSDAARQLGLHAIERRILSQAEVADLLGTSQATVSRWYRESTGDAEQEPQK